MEIWKDIKDYEGFYKVSSLGRIFSVKRNIIKVLDTNNSGYQRVQLRTPYKKGRYFVHRLVAEHFLNNYLNKPEVNHIDCDKTNNTVSNLEWVTKSENSKHAYLNNRLPSAFKGKPVKVSFDTSDIFFNSYVEAAKSLGTSPQTISRRIVDGKKHKPLNCYISSI